MTAISLLRTRPAGADVVLYSQPVSTTAPAAEAGRTMYVAAGSGSDDNGDGTQGKPFQTISKAMGKIIENGGQTTDSAADNQIILMEAYVITTSGGISLPFPAVNAVPVTIRGMDGDSKINISTSGSSTEERNLVLTAKVIFENLEFGKIGHVYADGYDLRVEDTVSAASNTEVYLYGAGRQDIPNGAGSIYVAGGRYIRIAGYIRSGNLSALPEGKNRADITVTGNAYAATVLAGCASGPILNANAAINVEGNGKVDTLIGGNQGFNDGNAAFTGNTAINIRGGTVTNVYGAGSGRGVSLPTYKGSLDINVEGGNVTNIYGSGAAAYVISPEKDTPSQVNISVSGGTVGNIYAAGLGGSREVSQYPPSGTSPTIMDSGKAQDCGSLTGHAAITVSGNAQITGNIYASGKGYDGSKDSHKLEYGQRNAYLNGECTISLQGGTVKGSIYGGGQGINKVNDSVDYSKCARVEPGSTVSVNLLDGIVEGDIYGGGEVASVLGSTAVTVKGGTVWGNVYGGGREGIVKNDTMVTVDGGTIQENVYGGGKEGIVEGRTTVNIVSGIIGKSVFGGAQGKVDESGVPGKFVIGGATVNMTGGTVSNLYGGSQRGNDGPLEGEDVTGGDKQDLIFVNLVGGTVNGRVFGGSYRGTVNGSTHLHIGAGAIGKCKYYASHTEDNPRLSSDNALSISGSVYAGGDYGDGRQDYETITVNGYSHVYIDGDGYSFDSSSGNPKMTLEGGVFGSGASCDAGDVRLVTLEKFGSRAGAEVTGKILSIQRADQVRLIDSHVRLSGQKDVANENQQASYSLNRIGNHGNAKVDADGNSKLGDMGNSLVLQGGSTLVLDSDAIEIADYKSVDSSGTAITSLEKLHEVGNTIRFTSGTVLRIACRFKTGNVYDASETYGKVDGYSFLMADNKAAATVFARIKPGGMPEPAHPDGGFYAMGAVEEDSEFPYINVEPDYRYWKMSGADAVALRQTVLTAQDTGGDEDVTGTMGTVTLPPVEAGTKYQIEAIEIKGSVVLTEAALKSDGSWAYTGNEEPEGSPDTEKSRMMEAPTTTFGLFMDTGEGFQDSNAGKVISSKNILSNNANTIIGAETTSATTGIQTPQLNFYLTYANHLISKSQDVGTVIITVRQTKEGTPDEIIQINADIITKASALDDSGIELFASQSGTYTAEFIIPKGAQRPLSLVGVEVPSGVTMKKGTDELLNDEIAITMQPVQGHSGEWEAGVMDTPLDLAAYQGNEVALGTTDGRYDASIKFVLRNAKAFTSREPAELVLSFKDESQTDGVLVKISVIVHWEGSMVSGAAAAAGKQYNARIPSDYVVISPNSSVTAAFNIRKAGAVDGILLELQDKNGAGVNFPKGTDVTLIDESTAGGTAYYTYASDGDGAIALSEFQEMWHTNIGNKFGMLHESLTVIVDFSPTDGLGEGEYALVLQDDNAAVPTEKAEFTVVSSVPNFRLTGTGGLSRGTHTFTLTASVDADTRLAEMAAVISSGEGSPGFPEGTSFAIGRTGIKYYPKGGKVYLPGIQSGEEIIMDTGTSSGLSDGNHLLVMDVYPVGMNTGSVKAPAIPKVQASYDVRPNPTYGLMVSLGEGSRVIPANAGGSLEFNAVYRIDNDGESSSHVIRAGIRKKTEEGYTAIGPAEKADEWTISDPVTVSGTSGTGVVTVNIPAGVPSGTYRAVFQLEDKTVFYNFIVQAPGQ